MARTVTVTVVNDAIAQGTVTTTISHTPSSTDPLYNSGAMTPETVVIQDDDVASIVAAPLTMQLAEPDQSSQFVVRLTSQPTASVTVPLRRSNEQVILSASQVVLTSANWSTGVPVTVTARRDNAKDGTVNCTVPALARDQFGSVLQRLQRR